MKKTVQVYKDGSKSMTMGDVSPEPLHKEIKEEYEVDVPDKDFQEMMKQPQKMPLEKIKNKRKTGRGRNAKINKSPQRP